MGRIPMIPREASGYPFSLEYNLSLTHQIQLLILFSETGADLPGLSLPSPHTACSISIPRYKKSLPVNPWLWSGAELCGSMILRCIPGAAPRGGGLVARAPT